MHAALYYVRRMVGLALSLENSPRMNLDCGGMWDLRQVRSWCQGSQRAQTSKVVSNSGLFGPFFVVGRAQFLIRLTGRQNLIDHNQEVVPPRPHGPLLPAVWCQTSEPGRERRTLLARRRPCRFRQGAA